MGQWVCSRGPFILLHAQHFVDDVSSSFREGEGERGREGERERGREGERERGRARERQRERERVLKVSHDQFSTQTVGFTKRETERRREGSLNNKVKGSIPEHRQPKQLLLGSGGIVQHSSFKSSMAVNTETTSGLLAFGQGS